MSSQEKVELTQTLRASSLGDVSRNPDSSLPQPYVAHLPAILVPGRSREYPLFIKAPKHPTRLPRQSTREGSRIYTTRIELQMDSR